MAHLPEHAEKEEKLEEFDHQNLVFQEEVPVDCDILLCNAVTAGKLKLLDFIQYLMLNKEKELCNSFKLRTEGHAS